MIKNKAAAILFIFSFFLGCKKDNSPASPPVNNTWTFDNITNVVTSTSRIDAFLGKKAIVFYASEQGSKAKLYAVFKSLPTKSDNYQIVEYSDEIDDNKCLLEGTDSAGNPFSPYLYNDPKPPVLTVTLKANNKIALSIPEISVSFPQPSFVFKLKGSLYEQ
ncbi:hypothetical protein ACFGVS_18750 [Mucilaginibacter sp. AW1-7]|jgi:hypothetical protein|uniref:hypothetical protein n=1 Tax=Mucilaginibacter sp. AW1-7 TaxID=3349874 RepID=UPI003F73A615